MDKCTYVKPIMETLDFDNASILDNQPILSETKRFDDGKTESNTVGSNADDEFENGGKLGKTSAWDTWE